MNKTVNANLNAVRDLLLSRQEIITQTWVSREKVRKVLQAFSIEPGWFLDQYGNKIFASLVRIIQGFQPPGECPHMNRMVRFLREKDMTVTDVHAICTGLRRTVMDILFSSNDPETVKLPEDTDKAVLCNELADIFDQNFAGVLSVFQDVISQKDRRIEHYMEIIDKHVIISKTDLRGIIIDVSQAFCDASGYTRKELIGKPHNIVRHPDMPAEFFRNLWSVIQSGSIWQGKIKNRRKNGTAYWVEGSIQPLKDHEGNLYGYMAIRHDITHTVMMFTDPLTQINNRLKFEECLETEIARFRRYGYPFSIILFDVDDFKKVNDTYGHKTGDHVLTEVTKAVQKNIRDSDIFARWGGEEFVVLAFGDLEETKILAERLREAVAQETILPDRKITCSFGVTQFRPLDTESSVFSRADAFLYRAKNSGKNRVVSDREESAVPDFQI